MWRSHRRLSWRYYASGRIEIVGSSTGNNWKRILPGVVISLVALAVVVLLLDVEKFWQALLQADLRFVLAAALLSVLWLVVRGFVWRTLLQDRASYRDSFLTINEGYVLNNILPFRLGEVARALLLSRKTGLDFWQVVPSILIERALDMGIASGLFLSTLPFVIGVSWARQAAIVIAVVVIAGLGSIYILARNREGVLVWIERSAERRPLMRRLTGKRVVSFFDGLQIITDGRLFLRAVGWEGLNWLVAVLQYYALLWAFFPRPGLLTALFALGVASLGIATPSSPGAVGVFEAALVAALAAFGLDVSAAAAYALTTHAFSYLFTGLIGGYGLYRDGESLSSLYKRLGRMKSGGESQPPVG
jgi:glycosyltransferase 2 family protein